MSKKSNELVKRLSNLWVSQRGTATVEQKNEVGLAYLSNVLGLGDDAALRFAENDQKIYHQVGLMHGGVKKYTPDLDSFWKKIQELFPGVYTDEDITFLVEQRNREAPWIFICDIAQPHIEVSLLHTLLVNAHVNK